MGLRPLFPVVLAAEQVRNWRERPPVFDGCAAKIPFRKLHLRSGSLPPIPSKHFAELDISPWLLANDCRLLLAAFPFRRLAQPGASLPAAITDALLAASKSGATEAITMSLIDPESAPVKKEQLNVRVHPSVAEMVRNYCEFLKSSSQHHVVEQLLRYAFSRDREFQAWLEQRPATQPSSTTVSKKGT